MNQHQRSKRRQQRWAAKRYRTPARKAQDQLDALDQAMSVLLPHMTKAFSKALHPPSVPFFAIDNALRLAASPLKTE